MDVSVSNAMNTAIANTAIANTAIVNAATAAPFNALAATYDAAFTETLLGRLLRDAVHHETRGTFRAGDRVLDLGCGTGEDAARLAGRGISVHGFDQSPAMIETAHSRHIAMHGSAAIDRPGSPSFSFAVTDLNDDGPLGQDFDGALLNFGVMNCIRDRAAFGKRLAAALRPGARAALVVMGPYCPWEWIWYLARGDTASAFRRLRRSTGFRGAEVSYPSPAELERDLSPFFVRRRLVGLGVLLPPTYAGGFIERHPALGKRLASAEERVRHRFPAAWLGDHYLMELERA